MTSQQADLIFALIEATLANMQHIEQTEETIAVRNELEEVREFFLHGGERELATKSTIENELAEGMVILRDNLFLNGGICDLCNSRIEGSGESLYNADANKETLN